MRSIAKFAAGAALFAAAFAAHAGGPLGICHNIPIKYPGAGSVTLRYDGGTGGLGTAAPTKAQADALVSNAIAYWTSVSTATVTLSRGADLPVDVTTANYLSYILANPTFSDGISPVVYDTDGSIIDTYFGTGANNSILGFAGSAWSDNGSICQYTEGQAIISGHISISTAVMTNVLAHEIGHLIGMDHTQLDSTQGLAGSNYPLMYPIAFRSLLSLHEDDAAAVTALYPDTNVNSNYGEISGTFTTSGGTPILGANIWAQGTPGTFSIVSDYKMQNTGYFRMLLPPGTYTLHAEVIDTQFTGGSGVGPYSDDWTSSSFQPPLWSVGGTASVAPTGPMAAATLGGGTPTQIVITAGCAATATFHPNGTGAIGGNCVVTIPPVPVPGAPSGQVPTTTPSLLWTPASGATGYRVRVQNSGGTVVDTTLTLAQVACKNNTGACAYTTPALANETAHTWQVAATNSAGQSAFSTAMAFTTHAATTNAPPVPVPALPSGSIASTVPTFLWNAAPGATGYSLRVLASDGAVAASATLTLTQSQCPKSTGACAYTFPAPLVAGSYTWSVRAENSVGASAYSTGMPFDIAGSTSAPSAPVLSSPSGNVATTTPTYVWYAAPGATSYTIRLMNGSTVVFTTPLTLAQALCPKNKGACAYTAPAALAGHITYTWQVSAGNSAGSSSYSAPFTFTTP